MCSPEDNEMADVSIVEPGLRAKSGWKFPTESDAETSDESDVAMDVDLVMDDETQKLRMAQRSECGWKPIIDVLEGAAVRVSARLQRKSREFVLINGLLHRKIETETGPKLVIIVPREAPRNGPISFT